MSWFARPPDFENTLRPELGTLYRVALRMTISREDAEDLVQQTLILAHKAWSRFDGKHLRSWLVRIMRNAWINTLRDSDPVNASAELEVMLGGKADVLETLIWQERMEQIGFEMDKLPEEQRTILQLCVVEDFSYEDAAKALSVPVGTVRSRLARARDRLRQTLETPAYNGRSAR